MNTIPIREVLEAAGVELRDDDGRTLADCPLCEAQVKVEYRSAHCFGLCADEDVDAAFRTLPVEVVKLTSWEPVDLAPILAGTHIEESPSILERTDGAALIYARRRHAFLAEPESCKGWAALCAVKEVLDAGGVAVYIDFEDEATTALMRLRALGTSPDAIVSLFVYIRPDEAMTDRDWDRLLLRFDPAPALVVLDGVTEALTLHGFDLNDNADVARWQALLPRRLAGIGCAVLELDHVVKSKEGRGRYGIGAQHKLAGIDVAYTLEVVEPFGHGREGRVRLKVTKDRPGYVRAFADGGGNVGLLRLRSAEDGSVTVALEPPLDALPFRPTRLMQLVSEAIEASPGIKTGEVRDAVPGRGQTKDTALRLLVSEGFVRVEVEGPAHKHYALRPFRVHPCPDHVPDKGSAPVSLVPPPRGDKDGAAPGERGHQPSLVPLSETGTA